MGGSTSTDSTDSTEPPVASVTARSLVTEGTFTVPTLGPLYFGFSDGGTARACFPVPMSVARAQGASSAARRWVERAATRGRFLGLFVLLFKLLTVLSVVSLSGVTTTVRDTVAVVVDHEWPLDNHDDCGGEQSCPMECPSCHAHPLPYLDSQPVALEAASPRSPRASFPPPITENAPPGPSRNAPFRPPRMASTATV